MKYSVSETLLITSGYDYPTGCYKYISSLMPDTYEYEGRVYSNEYVITEIFCEDF